MFPNYHIYFKLTWPNSWIKVKIDFRSIFAECTITEHTNNTTLRCKVWIWFTGLDRRRRCCCCCCCCYNSASMACVFICTGRREDHEHAEQVNYCSLIMCDELCMAYCFRRQATASSTSSSSPSPSSPSPSPSPSPSISVQLRKCSCISAL